MPPRPFDHGSMNLRSHSPAFHKIDQTSCDQCGEILDVSSFKVFDEIGCPFCDALLSVPGGYHQYLVLQEIERHPHCTRYLCLNKKTSQYEELYWFSTGFADNHTKNIYLDNAKAACALRHPHILQSRFCGIEKDTPFIFREIVDGFTLVQCIDPDSPQDELGCLKVLLSLCQAMEYAESKNTLHGDISPENILCNDDGYAWLTNFAVAQFSENYEPRIEGSPQYIAPEKANREWTDFRSDQFSLGASFWHIMSGYAPFSGETIPEVVRARYTYPQPDICLYAPHISEETSAFLQRMMASEPRQRFPIFSKVVSELEELIDVLEDRYASEDLYRKGLETEAYDLHQQRIKNRFIVVGCVILTFVLGYFYFRFIM